MIITKELNTSTERVGHVKNKKYEGELIRCDLNLNPLQKNRGK